MTDIQSTAKVVVIGGGVVGVSTLYHLVKKGWSDVCLIERKELTSGSTWHAAGLLPLFNMSYSVGQLHKYSVNLYKRLGEETGQDVGIRPVSNIRLATNQDRMDEYLQYAGVAQTIGVEVEFLTPDEVVDIWPFAKKDGLIGAMRHPEDGYVQPADLTQAFAKGAREGGAKIYRYTTVEGIEQLDDGMWKVYTDKGDIICEHVVSCTGSFARKTGEMVGLDIPVVPVEHQYIVTESHPDILKRRANGEPELGVLRESDGSWYMREEAGGLILGPYEHGAPACYLDGPDEQSEYELFQEDIDRLMPHIESAMHRVPIFEELGIKKVYNGAIAYTPDGNPIVGPAWDKKNFWLNEGHSFGITAAGGAGWQLAEWIVEGEPTVDMLGVDPRRFGPYATKSYLVKKNEEAYADVFAIHYPDEERPAARPLRTSPCYDRMKERGAVFGQLFGWERPNWFAPEGIEQKDEWSFRRSSYYEHVGNECKNTAINAGLLDMTAFAKCRVQGPGALKFLNWIFAQRMPVAHGKLALCHGLTSKGGVHSEFTIQRESKDSFYMVSAGANHRLDHDWLKKHMPTDGSVQFTDLTNSMGVLVLAGPKSRDILQPITGANLSNECFPWLTGQETHVGYAPVKLLRVNFVGELGWEIHHPIEYQNHIFDSLFKHGDKHGLKPFGIRAMNSMRLEKSYRLVGTEMSIEYSAYESGLHRFVNLKKKNGFLGKDALLEWEKRGFDNAFVTLEVMDVNDADVIGNNPIYKNNEVVGRATSGGYGWRMNKSLALGMVHPYQSKVGNDLSIEILGKRYKCKVLNDSPHDPENEKLRS
ncbi:FAD-dependent oxidoreductase [Hellea sp.]|nr:FAD-dependent oxidoreductase [Hellea sp.]MDA8888974.1 FAD-dependent oxidoreductase [Hellea sp.]MDB4844740.1 FAD-dependent oxidoreductase [Hellea sp.]MDC0651344.1 FAD-dependent oxidoreductase [Hellea sp.]MDC1062629.1 FAD-dependent oxidoreductase [Hellea sp.]